MDIIIILYPISVLGFFVFGVRSLAYSFIFAQDFSSIGYLSTEISIGSIYLSCGGAVLLNY